MNTNAQDANKSRRLKTIVVSTIALIVIIIVGVWAISSALGSNKKSEGNATAEVAVSNDQADEQTTNPGGVNVPSPADQYSANTETPETTTETADVPAQTNMPATGPAEVIFSALMLGVVTYLIGLNVNLVKENQ